MKLKVNKESIDAKPIGVGFVQLNGKWTIFLPSFASLNIRSNDNEVG